MNCVLIYIGFLYAMLATAVWAEELPGIVLDEGENEIAVTVVNRLNRDVTGLTIEAEQRDVPEWLTNSRLARLLPVRLVERQSI